MTASNRGEVLSRVRLGFAMLAPVLVVVMLVALLPPDGNERADWFQFIGRFHPLFVHFPIALFLLVPVLEIVGRSTRFAYLRLSVSFVLVLATIAKRFRFELVRDHVVETYPAMSLRPKHGVKVTVRDRRD
jgi:uncharacterized membrane protein